jgi:hypothetical protein
MLDTRTEKPTETELRLVIARELRERRMRYKYIMD